MSECQYYEFQAVDRPLTAKEMSELRSYSTRAQITPASFVNDYSFGSFKGNEDAWMEKYFDAFLYLANWGTHVPRARGRPEKGSRWQCCVRRVTESGCTAPPCGPVPLPVSSIRKTVV